MIKSEKREMKQGSGDAMAAAFELVATPAIFGFLGWLLDRKLEIFPICTLVFVAVTITYASWRLYKQFTLRLTQDCLLYTSPSPRDLSTSRMPSSA